MWAGLVLSVSCLLAAASGSKILFGATPDVIQTNLTQAMTMRCSLNDTDLLPTVGGVVGKRDVTQTADNMQTVSSIVITRNNGDHVATLIQGQPAKAVADLGTMQVHGSLTNGSHGEMGYLQLDWIYPSTAQTGEYVCEINTISPLGHNVVFSTSTEIGESVPTIGELMFHVSTLRQSSASTQEKLHQLEARQRQVQVLQAQVCGGSHLQVRHGQVECGDSGTWTSDSHGPHDTWPASSSTRHVTFTPPYDVTPVVEVGVSALNHDNNANIRYQAEVVGLDRFGFDVHCETWFDSRIYRMSVSWLSVSQ